MPADSGLPPPPPRASLVGDAWGGFASMLVALPSSIAYGVTVFSLLGTDYVAYGVRAGLVGAMTLGRIAAVLAALASASLIHEPDPARIVALITLVALLSAALQLFYGFIGGGRLIKYIPYPLVSGYLSAVGVIIFIGQLPR